MSPLWLLPGLILLVGGAAIVALLRVMAEEAKLLTAELGRQREVGSAARRLATDLSGLHSPMRDRR